jgi:hypothetical protein
MSQTSGGGVTAASPVSPNTPKYTGTGNLNLKVDQGGLERKGSTGPFAWPGPGTSSRRATGTPPPPPSELGLLVVAQLELEDQLNCTQAIEARQVVLILLTYKYSL